jgi:hypothetical protein
VLATGRREVLVGRFVPDELLGLRIEFQLQIAQPIGDVGRNSTTSPGLTNSLIVFMAVAFESTSRRVCPGSSACRRHATGRSWDELEKITWV